MKLEDFFRAALPLMLSESSLEEFEAAVGPVATPPKGTAAARIAFYQRLVRRDAQKVLEHLYAPVRLACGRLDEGLWETLSREYLVENRPSSWDLNAIGDRFPDFLCERRTREGEQGSQPIWLEELADLCWASYVVKVHVGEPRPDAVNPAVEIREHTHRVRAFYEAASRGDPELPLPEEGVELSILFRDPRTLRGRIVGPSLPMLVTLAWLLGELEDEELKGTGLSEEALREGLAALRQFGIVGPELEPTWPS